MTEEITQSNCLDFIREVFFIFPVPKENVLNIKGSALDPAPDFTVSSENVNISLSQGQRMVQLT